MNHGELDIIFSCSDCKENTTVFDPAEDRDILMAFVLEASLRPVQQGCSANHPPLHQDHLPRNLQCTFSDQSSILSPRSPTSPLGTHQATVTYTPPYASASHVLNSTYTNTGRSFEVSADINPDAPVVESDIEDDGHSDTVFQEQAVMYEIVEGGTKQRAITCKLENSDGFAYTVKVCNSE